MNTLKDKLIHAVTAYDIKQSKRAGYNPYALGQYMLRIDEVCADIDAGADVRQAILAGFYGRLADVCLKVAALSTSTVQENRSGSICYTP